MFPVIAMVSLIPGVVPKNESRLSDEITQITIGLYTRGMRTTEIQEQNGFKVFRLTPAVRIEGFLRYK
jgi:hypothetical protein